MTETSRTPGASAVASPVASPVAPATDTATVSISVRFFAGAAEAAGAEQLHLTVPANGIAVSELVAELPRLIQEQQSTASGADESTRPKDDDGAARPSLERVCARSSFLINGVRARPETARLHPGDQFDVLPPFAGG